MSIGHIPSYPNISNHIHTDIDTDIQLLILSCPYTTYQLISLYLSICIHLLIILHFLLYPHRYPITCPITSQLRILPYPLICRFLSRDIHASCWIFDQDSAGPAFPCVQQLHRFAQATISVPPGTRRRGRRAGRGPVPGQQGR
jgi:hypothetical protein